MIILIDTNLITYFSRITEMIFYFLFSKIVLVQHSLAGVRAGM